MTRFGIISALALGLTIACAPGEQGPSEDQLAARQAAARDVCISERLLQRAEDELQTLEQLGVATGPLAFQQAYTNHATLRHATLALADSAVNHARNTTDSVRYDSASRAIQIRLPDPGSVEENVIRSYETNFFQILADEDHPCNWQAELETE